MAKCVNCGGTKKEYHLWVEELDALLCIVPEVGPFGVRAYITLGTEYEPQQEAEE